FAPGEHTPRLLQFLLTDFVGGTLQLDDRGHRFTALKPVHEILDARLDDGFGLNDRRLAGISPTLHQPAEVVHRVQINVGQATHFVLDVTRHGEINHHHGAVTARARGAFDHTQAQYGQRTGRTGHDDVEVGNVVGQIRELHGAGVEATGKQLGALGRAVGHDHAAGSHRSKVGGTELDHFTRADEQRIALGQVTEDA